LLVYVALIGSADGCLATTPQGYIPRRDHDDWKAPSSAESRLRKFAVDLGG